jgi:hypothetical protein
MLHGNISDLPLPRKAKENILSSSQIVQPCNLIQHADHKSRAFLLLQLLPHSLDLFLERLARIPDRQHHHGVVGARRPARPDLVDEVLPQSHEPGSAFLLDTCFETLSLLSCNQGRIDAHCLSALRLLRRPLRSGISTTRRNRGKEGGAGYHSCHVGTSGMPCFSSSQLLSSWCSAWLKYRPSVAKAAFSLVTTAHPAEPVKPVRYSCAVVSWGGAVTL